MRALSPSPDRTLLALAFFSLLDPGVHTGRISRRGGRPPWGLTGGRSVAHVLVIDRVVRGWILD